MGEGLGFLQSVISCSASIRKYCDAAMIEIYVLNRLAENEKYRSLSFILYPSSDCFFCSTTNMLHMAGRGLEVKPRPTIKCVLGHDFILHFPAKVMGWRTREVKRRQLLQLQNQVLGLKKNKDEYESNDSDEGE
ncbi:hypothetical protein ZEAMMB73_Zm00001d010772 [Zea mays]|uniref:Uncharacterized protein n=1 Tax=Zea mays TaxID=4577 RepID=A0A1D6FTJ5_MAIZE|nr:hypothetical protein ZEAMMB73_Zm00001d010772 [Zea mays]